MALLLRMVQFVFFDFFLMFLGYPPVEEVTYRAIIQYLSYLFLAL